MKGNKSDSRAHVLPSHDDRPCGILFFFAHVLYIGFCFQSIESNGTCGSAIGSFCCSPLGIFSDIFITVNNKEEILWLSKWSRSLALSMRRLRKGLVLSPANLKTIDTCPLPAHPVINGAASCISPTCLGARLILSS